MNASHHSNFSASLLTSWRRKKIVDGFSDCVATMNAPGCPIGRGWHGDPKVTVLQSNKNCFRIYQYYVSVLETARDAAEAFIQSTTPSFLLTFSAHRKGEQRARKLHACFKELRSCPGRICEISGILFRGKSSTARSAQEIWEFIFNYWLEVRPIRSSKLQRRKDHNIRPSRRLLAKWEDCKLGCEYAISRAQHSIFSTTPNAFRTIDHIYWQLCGAKQRQICSDALGVEVHHWSQQYYYAFLYVSWTYEKRHRRGLRPREGTTQDLWREDFIWIR